MMTDPPVGPRPGGTYDQIPHLMFDSDNPIKSGLCLFDPDGRAWSDADLIAETTAHWASEWLHYYELWHLAGEWLGPSVGQESVAQMPAADEDADGAAGGDDK